MKPNKRLFLLLLLLLNNLNSLTKKLVRGIARSQYLFWLIFMIGVGGVGLAACSNLGSEQKTAPVIVLNPQMGGVNTEVVVNGEHFPAGMAVMLRLGPPEVGATPFSYASGTADSNGRFNLTFAVPESWPDGRPITEANLTVIVLNEDGSIKATAPFALQPGMEVEPTLNAVDGVTTPDPLLTANEEAIVNAVRNYLTEIGESSQAAIVVEMMEGDFTRVGIIPLDPNDPGKMTGYLKLVDGIWEVLVIGRDFDSEQLLELGIPATILPEEMLTPEG